jgi:sulfur-oxidizing protein SoxY
LTPESADLTAIPWQVREVDVPIPEPASRRTFLRALALVGSGLLAWRPLVGTERLLARPGGWSDPTDPEVPNDAVGRILKTLVGDRPIQKGRLSLDMPAVAEDGRVVPVIIESDLPMTPEQHVRAIHLIVDHNPDPHLAVFHLTPAIGSVSLETRIKMKRTTWVRAILETSTGEIWGAYAHVNVSLNGCG